MASPHCSSYPLLIIDIPPRVLDEFCRCIDCLTDWEWLCFVSNVMDDETSVQRFLMKRRAGDNATRELLWSWGQKLATMQDLEEILQQLELYRVLEILRQNSLVSSRSPERRPGHGSGAEANRMNCASVPKKVADCGACCFPSPPPPPSALLRSLQDQSVSGTDQKALSIPQQEISMTPVSLCHQWTLQQLSDITDGFSVEKRLFSGQFADIYLGQKADAVYAIKRIKEENGEQMESLDSFFQTEAQISFRCSHPNLLLLLGFCLETGHRCLITRFMENGSLDAALQAVAPHVLSWERRLVVAAGLLRAVRHLHDTGLLHGNIKSSNVFLDGDFSPKLGHAGPRFCPDPYANYTQIKTEELQRHQPYLPDTYLRRGQLTAHTDIFSAGVVLAEILTGLKAHDKSRDPAYLKDLIVREMEEARACVESGSPERLCAERIAHKHMDARPGRPPGAAGFYLASAVCACLIKKRVVLSEVIAMIEKAQRDAREEPRSMNVPEESCFDDASPVSSHAQGKKVPPSCRSPSQPQRLSSVCCLGASKIPPRTPCELDESGDYMLSPGGVWHDLGTEQPSCNAHPLPSHGGYPAHLPFLEINSPTESDDPSWGIEVNAAKQRLMENIKLYAEDKADSSILFHS